MIDSALRELEPTPYLNVVSETVVCLPDAIQLLTPYTLGNGFMQVLDWGKIAITAYDRQTFIGVRTFLNSASSLTLERKFSRLHISECMLQLFR
ncbi:formylmethanofuran dehydrogenase subunit E family protein [Thermodesulfobacteriota bacterium]